MALTSAADYPSLGFDPAPGDVSAVSTLRSVKRTIADVAAAVDGDPVEGWTGALATAFGELFELGPIESDAYRTWLENAARRGVTEDTILDIVRWHGIDQHDFAVLDGLEEVVDPDGKSSP
jgi:hypothetical protein